MNTIRCLFLTALALTLTFYATARAQTIFKQTVDSGGREIYVGQYNSQAIVNGNPAISYNDATDHQLRYIRASDANGASWGTPVIVDAIPDVGQFTSLAVVNGNPAISYYDVTNGDLKYVRATDASGTTWGTPVIVDSTGNVGQYTSLKGSTATQQSATTTRPTST